MKTYTTTLPIHTILIYVESNACITRFSSSITFVEQFLLFIAVATTITVAVTTKKEERILVSCFFRFPARFH